MTPEVLALFQAMRDKHGSWQEVALLTNTRDRAMRRLRNPERTRAITMTKLDEMIACTGVGSTDDYVWFTSDDLVALGIWDEPWQPLDSYSTEWRERLREKHKRSPSRRARERTEPNDE